MEEAEELGADKASGEWSLEKEVGEAANLSRESEELNKDLMESEDEQDSLCMVLAEMRWRNQEREMHIDPSSGTYNLDCDDANGGEDLEVIEVSNKPFL